MSTPPRDPRTGRFLPRHPTSEPETSREPSASLTPLQRATLIMIAAVLFAVAYAVATGRV